MEIESLFSIGYVFKKKYIYVYFHRDILITPKRISYTREKEKELYESLINLTNSKQNEIQKLISEAIHDIKEILIDQACSLDISGKKKTKKMKYINKSFKKKTKTRKIYLIKELN